VHFSTKKRNLLPPKLPLGGFGIEPILLWIEHLYKKARLAIFKASTFVFEACYFLWYLKGKNSFEIESDQVAWFRVTNSDPVLTEN